MDALSLPTSLRTVRVYQQPEFSATDQGLAIINRKQQAVAEWGFDRVLTNA